jgi:membrane fusion protein (multidrug efflux system)
VGVSTTVLVAATALALTGSLSTGMLSRLDEDAAQRNQQANIQKATLASSPVRKSLGQMSEKLIADFAGHRSVSRPSQDATMGFPQPTMVREIASHGGAQVKKGQLLVRGDDAEDAAVLRLQEIRAGQPLAVQRAKAAMDLANVEYERLKTVESRGASGVQEVERARLSAEVARIDHLTAINNQEQEELQVQRLRARLDRLRLSAPFDGVVDQIMVDVGQSVSEQDKIIRVVQIDPLRIDVNTPTSDPASATVKVGDPAWVLCDVGGAAILTEGRVVEVAPTVEAASRTRRVRVELANPKNENPGSEGQLLSGQAVWVRYSEPSETVAASVK